MLAPFQHRVAVVGESIGAADAVRVVADARPDIVLCDVRMRGASGLDLCRRLRAGASGYLLKQISGEDLVRQLELARDGVIVIDTVLAGRAVDTAARLHSDEYWFWFWPVFRDRIDPSLVRQRAGCACGASRTRLGHTSAS